MGYLSEHYEVYIKKKKRKNVYYHFVQAQEVNFDSFNLHLSGQQTNLVSEGKILMLWMKRILSFLQLNDWLDRSTTDVGRPHK